MLLSALSMIKTSLLTLPGTGAVVLCKNRHFMSLVDPMDNLRNCSNQCNHVMSVTMEVAVFFRNNKLWSVVMLRK